MTRKYTGVQALRFVAALLVVLTHSTLYARERLDDTSPLWGFGVVGVDIFFVISGFVMVATSSQGRPEAGEWRTFATRRLIRIAPLYWCATTVKLLTLVAVPAAVLHAQLSTHTVVLSYLFLPSRNVDGAVEPLLGVGWTLTFEMFFYAVFTLALWLRIQPLRLCGPVLVGLSILSVLRPQEWPPALVYLDPIVLYFLSGMLIGSYVYGGRRAARLWQLVGVAALWSTIRILQSSHEGGFDVWHHMFRHATVVGLVLATVAAEPWLQSRLPRWATFCGDASYSLYLFHPLVAPGVPAVLARLGVYVVPLSVVGSVSAAVVVALVIFVLLERPMTNRLRSAVRTRRPVVTS